MIEFNSNIFGGVKIPDNAQVIFVSDLFADEYLGGAELTSQSLIDTSPFNVFKLKSKDVTLALLQEGQSKFWIFGNFSQLNPQLIPSIVTNLKYSILEYDYKYCKLRSPEKHLSVFGSSCDCHDQMNGKIISAFFYGSHHLWWMSEKQKDHYCKLFPFLLEKNNTVLSSVFDKKTLGYIKFLREQHKDKPRSKWIVLGSDSWVKGAQSAKEWCTNNGKDFEVVWNVSYDVMLNKLASAEGFVYLPQGGDTCPRMVIEAKLLGCQLVLNENVQHSQEEWFNTDNIESIEEYLYSATDTFWEGIKFSMNFRPSISGYTTTYNCISQKYPIEQCIKSMLQFCDEVCVVDGGSSDGTVEKLQELSTADDRIKLKIIPRDWSDKYFAIYDGMQKSEARSMCTKDFCWQMDSDEIVHEDDVAKIVELCRIMPKEADIISLPVIEYWGGPEKVRMDIQPWKWRLSKNKPNITHGVPKELRRYDSDGRLYASHGTDGCDMIDKETHERLPHISFYTHDAENARIAALNGNNEAKIQYENWFNSVINNLPGVFHYSWYDLERKITLYKDYWTKHWCVLYNQEFVDSPDQNMMFDVPWSQVTNEMIKERAQLMKDKLGGWIWHKKWDGVTTTPHMNIQRTQPKIMTNE